MAGVLLPSCGSEITPDDPSQYIYTREYTITRLSAHVLQVNRSKIFDWTDGEGKGLSYIKEHCPVEWSKKRGDGRIITVVVANGRECFPGLKAERE